MFHVDSTAVDRENPFWCVPDLIETGHFGHVKASVVLKILVLV